MYSQPRFGLVTPEQVRGALKVTGSKDPDVLAAALDQFAAPYRPLKWFGIWALVTGSLCTVLIILAFIGLPLLGFGWWAMRRAKRNRLTIEATYREYLASLGQPAAPVAPAAAPAAVRAVGALLLAVATAGGLEAQNEEVPAQWRGDYVAATAACTAPVKLRLEEKRIVLVNGTDSQAWGDIDFSHSWWGNSYQGIMFVSMPDYTRSINATAGPPFLLIFNDEEKEGMIRVSDLQPALARRFPLGDKPLKKCGGSSGGSTGAVRQAPGCAGAPMCDEATTFAATVTDVRTSTSGANRLVAVTIRVRNRMSTPLTLGYVQNSGLITDDQGNRYVLNGPSALRGLGEVSGRAVDPKFTLRPGEEADARLEFVWRPSRGQVFGTVYNLDLALRELAPLAGSQWQLGREHALQYRGLAPANGPAVAAATPGAAPAAGGVGASAAAGSCDGRPRCAASGGFTAEVVNLVPSTVGRHHLLQVTVRVTNAGAQPMILGYRAATSGAVDNLGNRYYFGRAGTVDGSVRGIGIVTDRQADPQFRLEPAGSRNATFTVTRFNVGRGELGTSWTWDVALEELEILPSRQVRTTRQHALSFPDLAAGGSAAAGNPVRGLLDRVRRAVEKP